MLTHINPLLENNFIAWLLSAFLLVPVGLSLLGRKPDASFSPGLLLSGPAWAVGPKTPRS